MRNASKRNFTLIELLVVIAIIAILAAMSDGLNFSEINGALTHQSNHIIGALPESSNHFFLDGHSEMLRFNQLNKAYWAGGNIWFWWKLDESPFPAGTF